VTRHNKNLTGAQVHKSWVAAYLGDQILYWCLTLFVGVQRGT